MITLFSISILLNIICLIDIIYNKLYKRKKTADNKLTANDVEQMILNKTADYLDSVDNDPNSTMLAGNELAKFGPEPTIEDTDNQYTTINTKTPVVEDIDIKNIKTIEDVNIDNIVEYPSIPLEIVSKLDDITNETQNTDIPWQLTDKNFPDELKQYFDNKINNETLENVTKHLIEATDRIVNKKPRKKKVTEIKKTTTTKRKYTKHKKIKNEV